MKITKKVFLLITTLFVFSFIVFKGVNVNAKINNGLNEDLFVVENHLTESLNDFNFQSGLVEISFDINYPGGINPETQTITSGTLAVKPEVTRSGYNFLGWFSGGVIFDFNDEVDSDLSLIAEWEVINYQITYVLYLDEPNDPVIFNPSNLIYNVESNFLLEIPDDRLSSVFVGWYTNSSFTGDAVTSLADELTGDITLYAKWEKRVHTCQYLLIMSQKKLNIRF